MSLVARRRLCILLLLVAQAAFTSSPSIAGEVRALWVVRTALLSPESVDQAVDDAKTAGFNVLLVQVRGRGDAFYRSDVVARSPLLARQPESFDPLARLIERARAKEMSVHAWFNTLIVAHFRQPLPKGHVLTTHPDWVMVPRTVAAAAWQSAPRQLPSLVTEVGRGDPDAEGLYLSPWAKGAGDHLVSVVRELLTRYRLDGIHLDFIRLPGPDYDYSRAALQGFAQATGDKRELLGLPARRPQEWDEYRRDGVTKLVARLAAAAREERPGLIVSIAAVPYEVQAVANRFQDWPRWLADGLLDVLCPMAYTTEVRTFRAQIDQAVARAGPRPIWAGIGAWRQSRAEVAEKVREARTAGAAGVVFFSHESLAALDPSRLRREVFEPDGLDEAGPTAEAISMPAQTN